MRNYILFGPPGSGKGTQAKLLEEKLGLVQISTGDIFRKEMREETELGKKAQHFISAGDLVPDEVTIGMLESNYLKIEDANGVLFDGFPRTIAQAEALDIMLDKLGQKIDGFVSLDVDKEELVNRLLERGIESGRDDDANEMVIRNRLHVYEQNTFPVLSYYEKQGKVVRMNGMGLINEVHEKLSRTLNA